MSVVPRFAALTLTALTVVACGPLGPLAGGSLSGPVLDAGDWGGLNVAETIQIETNPLDPYSVNVWGVVHGGAYYVPSSLILGADDPLERRWIQNVLNDPRVRLRIDGNVYERKAVRVEDPSELESARAALLAKYATESDEHAQRAWIFRMDPR